MEFENVHNYISSNIQNNKAKQPKLGNINKDNNKANQNQRQKHPSRKVNGKQNAQAKNYQMLQGKEK